MELRAKYLDKNPTAIVGDITNVKKIRRVGLSKDIKKLYTNLSFSEDIKNIYRVSI